MARRHGGVRNTQPYPNSGNTSDIEEFSYSRHYRYYVNLLAFQLFEWKNLPDSVDPKYLEMALHTDGAVGFFYDNEKGFMVSIGAEGQGLDHYRNPVVFNAMESTYHTTKQILRYDDDNDQSKAIMIYNNDLKYPTLSSLYMFADEMADIQQISRVNRKAQKTPTIVTVNEKNYYSFLTAYNQVDENNQVIFADKDLEFEKNINVLNNQAPYIVDKLRTEKNQVWNEVMTFLGINNANTDGSNRTQSAEVFANNEQVMTSANIFLKNRQIACERINRVFKDKLDKPIEVELRMDIVREFEINSQKSNKDTQSGEVVDA